MEGIEAGVKTQAKAYGYSFRNPALWPGFFTDKSPILKNM
jgi:hypothetical protein